MSIRSLSCVALGLALASSETAQAATMTFEGLGLGEGTLLVSHANYPGVTFSGFIIVVPGSPTVGFNGNSSGSGAGGADNANSGVTIAPGSDFFGTHTITFSAPTSGLALELVDVEVGSQTETVQVRVYASVSGGSPLHTVTLVGGSSGTGDGIRTPIALTGFAGDTTVRRIEVQRLTGAVGSNAGFAVDNVEYVLGSVPVQPSTWQAVKAVYGE
jgi:hypothetical protein